MRIPCATAMALAALMTLAPSAFGEAARLTSAGATFPERSYVLTLPAGVAADPGDITVRENGRAVDRLRVREAANRFAVMLVIDASSSMRGRPVREAMAAARAFARQRPAGQALGVVVFNGTVNMVLAPTRNGAAIAAAVNKTPRLAPRTRIFDATAAALQQIRKPFDAGAVVVLSDGRDIGSAATGGEIAAAAQRHHARLFTIGLRSRSFSPKTLQEVAEAGRGEFLGAVTPQQLTGVYERLSGELASIYSLRYRSTTPALADVTVAVGVASLTAGASYQAPRLKVEGAAPSPAEVSAKADSASVRFILTAGVALVVMVLVFAALIPVLLRRARTAALKGRIRDYGNAPGQLVGADGGQGSDAGPRGRFRGSRRWAQLELDLDLAGIDLRLEQALFRMTLVIVAIASLLLVTTGSVLFVLLVLVAVPLCGRAYVKRRISQRRAAFADQLSTSVQSIASGMRAGGGFVSALAHTTEDASEPAASELRRVVADERLGVPLEEAFERAVERMASRDLRQIGLVAAIQRETGGNAAEALDRVVQNVRAREDLRRLVRALTAQGRLAQRVLVGLPIAALAGLTLLAPEQMSPLYTTSTGHMMLIVAAVMIIAGALWIGKIVKIDP